MKRRNLLAILSTVSVLLASTPLLWLQADTAPAMKRMEAETSASLNLYCNLEDGGSGKVVGGSVGVDVSQTLAEIQAGGLDKSKTSYVEYTVNAPAAGEYAVRIGAVMGAGNAVADYPAAVVVNNGKGGDVYSAVFHYDEANTWAVGETTVTIRLQEGENRIACTGILKDILDAGAGWAYCNQDYLEIDGRLTAAPITRMWAVNDAVANLYSVDGSKLGGGRDATQTIADIEKDGINQAATSYAEYSVYAPEDGEYSITVGAILGAASALDTYTTAVVVNDGGPGRVYRADFRFNPATGYTGNGAACTVRVSLVEGRNVIRCTTVTKDVLNTGVAWAYCNMNYLDLDNRLTTVPAPIRMEAERDAALNMYGKLDNGGTTVGDSITSIQTAADIKANGLDDAKTSYVEYRVEAPAAGTYTLRVGAVVGANAPQSDYPTVVVVNGSDAYDAVFHFDEATAYAHGEAAVTVQLVQGINRIACTSMLQDVLDAGAEWAYCNQDYLEMDGRLTPKPVNRLQAENGNYNNKLNAGEGGGTGRVLGGSTTSSQTLEDIKANGWDRMAASYVEYKVSAPADGTYEIRVGAMMGGGSEQYPTAVIVNNGKGTDVYAADFCFNPGRDWVPAASVSLKVNLKEGVNSLITTALIGGSGGWMNLDYLDDVEGRLTHLHANRVDANAEKLVLNNYSRTDSGVGYGNFEELKNKVSLDNLMEDGNLENTPYVQMVVTAPEDGEYPIHVYYNTGADPAKAALGVVTADNTLIKGTLQGNWGGNAEIRLPLKKGDNKLIFTMPLPKDAASLAGYDWGNGWADLYYFLLWDGLTLAEEAWEDVDFVRMEAEKDARLNAYGTLEGSAENPSGTGITVGGGVDVKSMPTYADVAANGLSSSASYVEYTVNAPEAGEYDVVMGVRLGAGQALAVYPAAIVVNGGGQGNVYPANFRFDPATEFANTAACRVRITLREGLNRIACTNVLKDAVSGDSGWAYINQDYLDVEDRLEPVSYEKPIRMEAETDAYLNLYGNPEGTEENPSGTGVTVGGSADIHNVQTYADIAANGLDSVYTSYAEYTVDAPEAGEYEVIVGVRLGADKNFSLYPAAVVVNGGGQGNVYKADFVFDPAVSFVNTAACVVHVSLQKGLNRIACTSVLKDMVDAGAAWAYANQDYLDLDSQLTPVPYEKPARYESELYAMPNQIAIQTGREDYSGGGCLGAANNAYVQTLADIQANGIDGMRTAFADYQIVAEQAGTYAVYIGMRYGVWSSSGDTAPIDKAYMVVECGDFRQVIEAPVAGVQNRVFTVQVPFTAGGNVLRISGFTADSKFETGDVWTDFDYIELPKELAAEPFGGTVEAENSENYNYSLQYDESMSGGKYLGGADYNRLDESRVTFDTLTQEVMEEIPHVRFTLNAKKAGLYSVALRFRSGCADEVLPEEAWLAVVTNDDFGKKQKLKFIPGEFNMYTLAFVVELQEGENTLLATSPLCEFRPVEDGRVDMWADIDCLYLGGGLSVGDSFVSGEDNTGDSQLNVKPQRPIPPDDSTAPVDPGAPDTGVASGTVYALAAGCGALAAAILFCRRMSRRKTKQ